MESDHTIGFERTSLGLRQVYKHSEFVHYDNDSGQDVSSESSQERPISECGRLLDVYKIIFFLLFFLDTWRIMYKIGPKVKFA